MSPGVFEKQSQKIIKDAKLVGLYIKDAPTQILKFFPTESTLNSNFNPEQMCYFDDKSEFISQY